MVVVLGLALLSEVAVGLDAVLEAVELWCCQYKFAQWRSGTRYCRPLLRAFWAVEGGGQRAFAPNVPPSKSLRSGNRPGRLDA